MAQPPATPAIDPAQPLPTAGGGETHGGTRSSAGTNYGDFAPTAGGASVKDNPARGSELERDVMPPDADFSRPPPTPDARTDPGFVEQTEDPRPGTAGHPTFKPAG